MDLGLSAKTQAWIRVAMLTLASFWAAFTGAAGDDWVSKIEWMGISVTTIMTLFGAISGAPKDAREPGAATRATDQ